MGDSAGVWTVGNDGRGDNDVGGMEKTEKLLKVMTAKEA